MLHFKTTLVACACMVLSGAAAASPIVNDPNFDQTPAPGYYHYGITAWNANGDPAVNPSFAGNAGQDVDNQWNNGTPGNGEVKVGFISGTGGYIFQAISGFTPGDIYQITLLANARVIAANDINGDPAGLEITTSSSGPIYDAVFLPGEVAMSYDVPFRTVTAAPFTALASTVTVTLTNTGTTDSSLLISGFAITDIGHDRNAMIPEPSGAIAVSMGLLGLAVLRYVRPTRHR